MKYITFSRHFPKGHPKEGQPTYFVEKIWNYFRDETCALPDNLIPYADNYSLLLTGVDYLKAMAVREIKHHTIRAGNRYKPGETISLRVWSDKPYRSKQIEFAQVEVKKVWDIEINNRFGKASFEVVINGVIYGQLHYGNDNDANEPGLISLAKNDGLELKDFVNWFEIHPKKEGLRFKGQIICWSPDVSY